MQTVVDRALLLQQVSDFAVQQLVAELQGRLDHLENTLAAMVAAGALVSGAAPAGAPVARVRVFPRKRRPRVAGLTTRWRRC